SSDLRSCFVQTNLFHGGPSLFHCFSRSFFCSWIRVTSYYAISVCQVSRNPAISDHTRSNYGDVFNCSCCLLFIHVNPPFRVGFVRSEEHTSELQSRFDLVCRLLLEKKQV